MVKLRYDSRDKIFHQRFGQVTQFPDEFNLDSPLPDPIQPLGDVKCTCYTTCNIATDQDNIEFNIDDLWSRVPQFNDGADPRDVLGEAVKNGLLPMGKNERLKNWKSYWRADVSDTLDPFDAVRSTMMLIKSAVGCGTYWYQEWLNTDVLGVGKTVLGGHMYEIEGWKQVNGEPHLIIEAWLGRKLYMPRATFNQVLKPLGMQTWVLSTAEMDTKKVKTLWERISDLLLNIYIALRDRMATKQTAAVPVVVPPPTPTPVPPKVETYSIEIFCSAIEEYEGYTPNSRSYRNCNPGNVRYSPVGYLPIYQPVEKDKDGFAVFKDFATGWLYLKNLVKSKTVSNPEWTIYDFFSWYAPSSENDPKAYAEFVARKLDVDVKTFKIKQLA